MKSKNVLVTSLLALALITGCSKQTPITSPSTTPIQEGANGYGQIIVNIRVAGPAMAKTLGVTPFSVIAKRSVLTISAADMYTQNRTLTTTDSSITGTVTGIPAGKLRNFVINVYDSMNTKQYTGSVTADVIADSITPIFISINRVSGGVIFGGIVNEGVGPVLISKGTVGRASNDDDIYTMYPDGSNITLLYHDTGYANNPVWNNDKSKVAFISNTSSNEVAAVFIMNADGSGASQITNEANPVYGSSFQPQFVGTNKIWYYKCFATWDQRIYEMNYDGSGQRQVSTMNGQHWYFIVKPSKVYYSRCDGGNTNTMEIYAANLDFSGNSGITSANLYTFIGDVSSDGSKILKTRHTSYGTGPQNVYVMNSDGTNEVKLTSLTINGTSCSAPLRYSPDGTKIMYSYHNGTQWDIFIMNVDGSGQTNLTNTPGFNEMVSDWK